MSSGTVLSLNHMGEQTQLSVGGVAVALTLPTQFNADGVTPTRDERGRALLKTPSHMLVYTDKTVRWRADGTDPNGDMGMILLAGTTLNFLEPLTDFSAVIARIKFVKDATTTGNATLEVAFFD